MTDTNQIRIMRMDHTRQPVSISGAFNDHVFWWVSIYSTLPWQLTGIWVQLTLDILPLSPTFHLIPPNTLPYSYCSFLSLSAQTGVRCVFTPCLSPGWVSLSVPDAGRAFHLPCSLGILGQGCSPPTSCGTAWSYCQPPSPSLERQLSCLPRNEFLLNWVNASWSKGCVTIKKSIATQQHWK